MYALVDCNNFYASCERVFNPKILGRPVLVLSNNDGCVIARSNEAKALGFKMGDPYFKVREAAARQGVAVFSSNYTLYGDMSRRVMETLERFCPEVERYSIDEAFLDLADLSPDQLAGLAVDIRRTVKQWTGIPVSIGIAPTKTLAKAANRLAKKDAAARGWSILTPDALVEVLGRLPVGDVWGIGRRWLKRLDQEGVATALAFSRKPDDWIRRRFNVVGLRTAMELRGEPCISMELAPPPKKGLCVSRMFGRRLTEFEPIREALVTYVSRVGEKLRRAERVAGHMSVFLHSSPFENSDAYYGDAAGVVLPARTSDTGELIRHACQCLGRIFREGPRYSKCGVMLTDLSSIRQGDLFSTTDPARSRRLMDALDAVNRRMGRDALVYAASGVRRDWSMMANMKTQAYTTNWAQILLVHAYSGLPSGCTRE